MLYRLVSSCTCTRYNTGTLLSRFLLLYQVRVRVFETTHFSVTKMGRCICTKCHFCRRHAARGLHLWAYVRAIQSVPSGRRECIRLREVRTFVLPWQAVKPITGCHSAILVGHDRVRRKRSRICPTRRRRRSGSGVTFLPVEFCA